MKLRPYQIESIDEIRLRMRRGHKTVLLTAPTGSGKTILTAQMLKSASDKGFPSLFVSHRRELVLQTSKAFHDFGLPHGIIAAGFMPNTLPMVQICSIQTVVNRLRYIRKPKFIIFDESHHIAAKSWARLHAAYPEAFIIGLTATPERLDGAGLGKYFSTMVEGPTVAWLIENGFLSPYKLFIPAPINLSGVHTRMGEFVASELSAVIDKPTITGDSIKEYRRLANGKRAIIRGVSIEHSKHIAEQFNASGIPARHVDGKSQNYERDEAMRLFRRGDVKILCNVDLFSEGVDIPSVECVIDLRPTQSLTLWLQFCGRALRMFPGKDHAIIIDQAGNTLRHGLPDDVREWSLTGSSEKKSKGGGVSIKVCAKCYAAQFPGAVACKFCGHQFEVAAREVEQVDGELIEVDAVALRREKLKEQGQAQTKEQLIELGRRRGLKKPEAWAHFVFQARQARKVGR